MALRLIRALPGERPFLSPLPSPKRQGRIDARVAAPGPHDFAVRCRVSSGAEAPDAANVHRNPRQRYVTIAYRPLWRHGLGQLWHGLPFLKSGIFFTRGLDRFLLICP